MGLVTETAKAPVRQITDNWFLVTTRPTVAEGAFPGQIVFGAAGLADVGAGIAVRGIQSAIRRCRGFARLRCGVTATSAGTLRVFQGWTSGAITNFAVTFEAATGADTVSALQVVDADVPIFREFVVVRFTGTADLAGILEIGGTLLPIA